MPSFNNPSIPKLIDADLKKVVSRLPEQVYAIVVDNPVYVAGGFVRATVCGETPSDVDIFGPDIAQLQLLAHKLAEDLDVEPIETANAVTIVKRGELPVQFILCETFDDAPGLLNHFDFSVCEAVVFHDALHDHWNSRISEDFYCHLAGKRLVYTRPTNNPDPAGSLLRMQRFLARGYSISREDTAEIMSRMICSMPNNLVGKNDTKDESQQKICLYIRDMFNESFYQGLPA